MPFIILLLCLFDGLTCNAEDKRLPFTLCTFCSDLTTRVCACRWPWLLHHIAKEYRESPEDKDTDVLAVKIVQVLPSTLRLVSDVSLISINLAVKGSSHHECAK